MSTDTATGNGKVLVAGVGNIFLGDDGFGVRVAELLARRNLAPNVTVADFGIRSYDLAYAMMKDWDLVILIDALPGGGTPGTLYVMEPDPPGPMAANLADAHTMNPATVLCLVNALGGAPRRMLVVGCEPLAVEPDMTGAVELSSPVERALTEAVSLVEELIATHQSEAAAA